MKSSTGDTEFVNQNNQEFQRSSSEDEVVRKKQQNNTSQERQRENSVEDSACAPRHICSEQNTSDRGKNQGSSPEQVVRPKVRKLISSSQVDQETGFINSSLPTFSTIIFEISCTFLFPSSSIIIIIIFNSGSCLTNKM